MERTGSRLQGNTAMRCSPPEVHDPEIVRLVQATMADLLQALSVGVVIVDGTCRLLFANDLARQILRRADAIADTCGRLRPAHPSCRRKLSELIERMAGDRSDESELVGLARPTGNSLLILARRLGEPNGPPSGKVLLLLSDPELRADFASDDLGPLFELTPSELRLLGALLRGTSLKDYAAAAGISRNTARSQLKGIFQKTGFGRQAELVGAMLGDPLLHLAVSRGRLPTS
jgi:DNA-binding CsgD family transcriptional regulator